MEGGTLPATVLNIVHGRGTSDECVATWRELRFASAAPFPCQESDGHPWPSLAVTGLTPGDPPEEQPSHHLIFSSFNKSAYSTKKNSLEAVRSCRPIPFLTPGITFYTVICHVYNSGIFIWCEPRTKVVRGK